MNVTFHGPGRRRPSPSTTVLLLLAAVLLGGCSQLAGALAGAIPTPPDSTGASLPSAGPETPIPTSVTHPPAAASAGSGGHVGSHAIVCVQPIRPGGGGGPPCVPVGESLAVATALGALSPAERDAVMDSAWVSGDAACTGAPEPDGCAAPDSTVGVVTFRFRDGTPPVRVLVYRHADGALGATRLA